MMHACGEEAYIDTWNIPICRISSGTKETHYEYEWRFWHRQACTSKRMDHRGYSDWGKSGLPDYALRCTTWVHQRKQAGQGGMNGRIKDNHGQNTFSGRI